ncbi:MAG TPA: hypothetical protein DD490_27295 [Acidobacteria bacterium]|nr:hypothetical protein [Acidobacteriota bacterium]
MRFLLSGAAFAALLAVSTPAVAQITYSYQGNPFTTALAPYTTSMRVSGSFQVASTLAPSSVVDLSGSLLHFSFSDGIETRNETNSLICQFAVTTDAGGAITGYDIWLRESGGADPQHSLEARTANDLAGSLTPNNACGGGALNPFASVTGQPGVWTGGANVAAVPTVSGVGLAVLTLLLVGCALWRLRLRPVVR